MFGGKFEDKESPEECVIREVMEETGLILKEPKLRCVVTYVSNEWETEYMYVFTANKFEGELIECNEGELEWINKDKVLDLKTWEGDRLFLERILKIDYPFFTAKVEYEGEKLINYELNEY